MASTTDDGVGDGAGNRNPTKQISPRDHTTLGTLESNNLIRLQSGSFEQTSPNRSNNHPVNILINEGNENNPSCSSSTSAVATTTSAFAAVQKTVKNVRGKGRKRNKRNNYTNLHLKLNNGGKKWGFKRQASLQQQQQQQQQPQLLVQQQNQLPQHQQQQHQQHQSTQQQLQQSGNNQSQNNNNKSDLENYSKNINIRKHNAYGSIVVSGGGGGTGNTGVGGGNSGIGINCGGSKNVKLIFKNNKYGGIGTVGGNGAGVGILVGGGGCGGGSSKFFLPNDKRLRKELIIPPTKFLLGGNISDPLNLNSLQDEALNASMNAATPKSSPITTPPKIDVIIPPNIFDPLHLMDPVDTIEYENLLISPMKRKVKHRNRKKKPKKRRDSPVIIGSSSSLLPVTAVATASTGVGSIGDDINNRATINKYTLADDSGGGGDLIINTDDETLENELAHHKPPTTTSITTFTEVRAGSATKEILISHHNHQSEKEKCSRDLRLDLDTNSMSSSVMGGGGGRKRKVSESSNSGKNKARRMDSMDKIVSPVIPQPGAWKRPPIVLPMGAPRNRNRVSSSSFSEDSLPLVSSSTAPAASAAAASSSATATTVANANTSKMEDYHPLSETSIKESSEKHSTCDEGKNISLSSLSGVTLSQTTTTTAASEQSNTVDNNATMKLNEPITGATSTTTNISDIILTNEQQNTMASQKVSNTTVTTKILPEFSKYQYGNYNRYFGFNSLDEFSDVRLKIFKRHSFLFRDKDMLDIGCNVGHMTIAVAKKLNPKTIVGIDIDKNLIARAQHNISLYVKIPSINNEEDEQPQQQQQSHTSHQHRQQQQQQRHHYQHHHQQQQYHHHHQQQHQHQQQQHHHHHQKDNYFPISFPICYRGIPNIINQSVEKTPTSSSSSSVEQPTKQAAATQQFPNNKLILNSDKVNTTFPHNISFRTLNYVVRDESQLSGDIQQYDLILCLSVTKWIHLNFGDAGLKLAFRRMFNQLRPGGKLILEAQNWASYKKKKKLTENIFNNYKNIDFFPDTFHEYLLSPEVGFSHSYPLGIPRHLSKGFRRPIQLYVKGDFTPSQICWSDNYHPQTPYEAYRGYYADIKRQQLYLGTLRYHSRSTSGRTGNLGSGMCGSGGGGGGIGIVGGGGNGSNSLRELSSYHTSNMGSYCGMGSGGGGGGGGGGLSNNQYLNTPHHGLSSTSQYYNPLETDSYLPSYDNEIQTRHYCFASPLYSTVWSPPPSGRRSSSHTPLFGSIRRVADNDENYNMNINGNGGGGNGGSGSGGASTGAAGSSGGSGGGRHVYFPTGVVYDGTNNSSIRSIGDDNSQSPQTHHVYAPAAGGDSGNNSIRDVDLMESNSPKNHVYATTTASSPASAVAAASLPRSAGGGGVNIGSAISTGENSCSPQQNVYNGGNGGGGGSGIGNSVTGAGGNSSRSEIFDDDDC